MYKKNMTAEERQAYKEKSDKAKSELNDQIISKIKNFSQNTDDFLEFLTFTQQFYNYSMRNMILIQRQRPSSVFCGSFKFFNDLGYMVKKGEKGIKIFVPVQRKYIQVPTQDGQHFRSIQYKYATAEQKEKANNGELKTKIQTGFVIGNVFDITQTDCPKENYPKYFGLGEASKDHKKMYEFAKTYAEDSYNIQVEEGAINSITERGYFSPSENLIGLSEKFDDTSRLSTFLHELGHAVLFHKYNDLDKTPGDVREFEADLFSMLAYEKIGLDNPDTRLSHAQSCLKSIEKDDDCDKILMNSFERVLGEFSKFASYLDDKCEVPKFELAKKTPEEKEKTKSKDDDISR